MSELIDRRSLVSGEQPDVHDRTVEGFVVAPDGPLVAAPGAGAFATWEWTATLEVRTSEGAGTITLPFRVTGDGETMHGSYAGSVGGLSVLFRRDGDAVGAWALGFDLAAGATTRQKLSATRFAVAMCGVGELRLIGTDGALLEIHQLRGDAAVDGALAVQALLEDVVEIESWIDEPLRLPVAVPAEEAHRLAAIATALRHRTIAVSGQSWSAAVSRWEPGSTAHMEHAAVWEESILGARIALAYAVTEVCVRAVPGDHDAGDGASVVVADDPSQAVVYQLVPRSSLDDLRDPALRGRVRVRAGASGPRTSLVSGPDVWEVISVYRDARSVRTTAELLDLSPDDVQAAVNYYDAHSDEIDERIRRNDELGTLLESDWKARQPAA